MSEDPTPKPGASGTPGKTPEPQKTESTEDLQNSLNAARRREKEAADRAAAAEERLQALEAAEKKRQEKAAAEQGKWQEIAEAKEAEIAELNKYREKYTAWEQAESKRIEAAMDGISDEQKELVAALPLEKRMVAITQFKAAEEARKGLPAGKGGRLEGAPTLEDVQKIKAEYGPFSPQYRQVMAKYMEHAKR